MAIQRDNVNPSLLESPLDVFKERTEGSRVERRLLEERLRKWKDFQGTPTGEACDRLAGPMLEHFNYLLS